MSRGLLDSGSWRTSFSYVAKTGLGYDAHAYWKSVQGEYYVNAPMAQDAFLYSPAFAQLIWPLAQLPWPWFNGIWMLGAAFTFAYVLKPLGWKLAIPMWLICTPEMVMGNVFWLFALVVALGLRYPSSWVFVFLTKITPAIGPIWFAARREWKHCGYAAVTTFVVVGISFAIDPGAWVDWIEFLKSHLGTTTSRPEGVLFPAAVRIPMAVVLIFWGAKKTKYWTIPAAMVLASPVFGIAALTIFAGLPRLLENERKAELFAKS